MWDCRRCDHSRRAHKHWRAGTDCAIPGCGCERYGVPWLWLVLDYGGWLFVPLLAAVAWHAARVWSLTSFVVAASTICVLVSLAATAGRFIAGEIAEQRAAGARLRDLPAYWWAVAWHRIDGDKHDPMVLLDEAQRLDSDEPE